MFKLLAASPELVFIAVVAAVIFLLIVLSVIYLKVKSRAENRLYGDIPETEGEEIPEDEQPANVVESEGESEPEQEESPVDTIKTTAAKVQKGAEQQAPKEQEEPKLEQPSDKSSAGDAEEPRTISGKNGEAIEIAFEQDAYRFYIKDASGKIIGVSEPYKSKAGALKGIKSLAGYSDAEIFVEEKAQGQRFEIYKDGERYAYKLYSKNNVIKLSGFGFADEKICAAACNTIKELSALFEL